MFNFGTNMQRVSTMKHAKGPAVNSWVAFGTDVGASRKRLKSKKSGITAIDNYYDMLNVKEEVECLRSSTEFRRLITMIQSHWKAKRFPRCELLHVNDTIAKLVNEAKTSQQQENLIRQLEEYLKYIHDFSKLEQQITNLINQRYTTLTQLGQISAEVKNLKQFESDGPKIMLTLREQAIRIVKLMCKFSQWRNPEYIRHQLDKDMQMDQADPLDIELPPDLQEDAQADMLSNSFFYFESKAGQGNVLDFIRSGRVPHHSGNTAGRSKLQFKMVKTHILDRMSLFFADDKILFLPKDERQIERDLKMLDGTRDRYHTQEVGIFYKIIEQLKMRTTDEEQRYLSVF